MDTRRLLEDAAKGDLAAGRSLLTEVCRRGDPQLEAKLRGVPAFAWPGCDFAGHNSRGQALFAHRKSGLRCVEIEAGEKVLGPPEAVVRVHSSPFLISEVLVPNALLARFVAANPEHEPAKTGERKARYGWGGRRPPETHLQLPATSIDWFEAIACARWYGFELPTGQQWELAARAADGAVRARFEGDLERCRRAQFDPIWSPSSPPDPALDDLAGPRGVLQMGWGLWEWCRDPDELGAERDDPRPRRFLMGMSPDLPWRQIHGNPQQAEPYYGLRFVLEPGRSWLEVDTEEHAPAIAAEVNTALNGLKHRLDPTNPARLAARQKQLRSMAKFRAASRDQIQLEPSMSSDADRYQLVIDPSTRTYALEPEPREKLQQDLESLDLQAIALNIPRDDKGRIELKTELILAYYADAKDSIRYLDERFREEKITALVLRTPLRQKDARRLSLSVETVNLSLRNHWWFCAPWKWSRLAASSAMWGPLRPDFDTRSDLQPAERALRALQSGRLLEAFELVGVKVSDECRKLVDGQALNLMHRLHLEPWAVYAQEHLARSAPWRFAALVDEEDGRLARWRAQKKGRVLKPVLLPLFVLPHQITTIKTRVVLTRDDTGGPQLAVIDTGSDRRVGFELWQRDWSVDLALLTV